MNKIPSAMLLLAFLSAIPAHEAFAQLASSQKITAPQQAAFGWVWASQAVKECQGGVQWNTSSGKPVSSQQALKLLVNEGHKKSVVLKAFRDRSALPFVQLDRWMVAAGLKPTQSNQGEVFCVFAKRVAGSDHPVGRFLRS